MIEITGTEGTLSLPDPNTFEGPLRFQPFGAQEWRELPVAGSTAGRGTGVLDMARAIRSGAEHRASGDLAQHVLELMSAITAAAEQHAVLPLESAAPHVPVLPEGWDPATPTLT